jgi:polyisoprenyl-teichoic acid--peptidoglycan teichoic acid transferase
MAELKFNENNSINLLNKDDNLSPRGLNRGRIIKKIIKYTIGLIVVAFLVFTYQVLFTGSSLTDSWGNKLGFWNQLKIIAQGSDAIKGYSDDRINILLLGIGGVGHDGPNLTDTIMLASIQPSTKKVSLISIPRDLLVDIPEQGWWKINNAYHFGQKNGNQGGALVSQVVSNITGLPIQYYFRVDFDGFEKFVDDIGGVKVNVDRTFTDYSFPTYNDKYQTVSFEKGWQTMDGATALKFARSRHGNNGESGDFARSKRQQKIIQAVKDRLFSAETLLSQKTISNLIDTLKDNIDTNLEIAEMIELAKLSRELDTNNLINVVIDDRPNGYLYATKFNEAYVLRPQNNDFGQIQMLAKNIFSTATIAPEQLSANLEIKNGTLTNGLAYKYSLDLKSDGFKVLKIGNAPTQNFETTVIYDLSAGNEKNLQVATLLSTKFQSEIKTEIPDWVKNDADLSTQYYIILGKNAITN